MLYLYSIAGLIIFIILNVVAISLVKEHNKDQKSKPIFSRTYKEYKLGTVILTAFYSSIWIVSVPLFFLSVLCSFISERYLK